MAKHVLSSDEYAVYVKKVLKNVYKGMSEESKVEDVISIISTYPPVEELDILHSQLLYFFDKGKITSENLKL